MLNCKDYTLTEALWEFCGWNAAELLKPDLVGTNSEMTEAHTRSRDDSLGLGRLCALMWAAAENSETSKRQQRQTSHLKPADY